MQDKYVGDIGDFGKYGLLRVLTQGLAGCVDGKPSGLGDGERQLRLGVIWHYVAVRRQLPPLGLAFKYILDPNALERDLIQCDPELYDILSGLIGNNRRSVGAVEQSAALPKDTVYFRDPVNNPAMPREVWFQRAIDAVRNCDVVFLDPDNGLADDNGNPNGINPEHATYQEAAKLWEPGKSLVIYQHLDRTPAEELIGFHAANLRRQLGISGPPGSIIALRFHRRFARVFFVIPNLTDPSAAQLLRARVQAFLDCGWGAGGNPHFTRVDC